MTVWPQAFFLPAGPVAGDQRFCIFHPAHKADHTSRARGLVLYLHPFAEELNKSRRMAALQARALARAGFAVLQLDLKGCGDSAGDFGQASWQDWLHDVTVGYQWLNSQEASGATTSCPYPPFWLWGLRAGCLLAVEAAKQLPVPCNFLFWQPPSDGKPLLQQFLRLKAAGDMLAGETKGVMTSMRQQLATGSSVEIAGYTLSAALATGLERAILLPSAATTTLQRVEWFEVSSREDASVSPVSANTINQWNALNYEITSHVVRSPAFWQTSEIEEAPELISTTTTALLRVSP